MISEKHDANFIYFWLTEWLRISKSIPKEFTCDMSLALLNAGARAFGNQSSLATYIDTLFKCIISEDVLTIVALTCFVRVDINHLMKNVSSSPSLKNVRPKVKEFFVRCVAELVKTTDIKTARQHMCDVLTVAYSQTEGESFLVQLMIGFLTGFQNMLSVLGGSEQFHPLFEHFLVIFYYLKVFLMHRVSKRHAKFQKSESRKK